MEGSLVLALMLDEASSPVHRLSPTKLESLLLVLRKLEYPHYIQQSQCPTSRFTYPKALASKTYVGTSLAGPWMEDKRISSWWLVDLGEHHQLMFKYYIFRRWVRAYEDYVCLDGHEGISGWENMDELENSTVTWNSMVTSVENYTAMKWPVDCLHYTCVPFNYHI
ncbi:hypothetical protein HID58_018861 [Brassica napus]|uniref:Uncharacterized protein n=1 Tax=Brassica napus TaxID=3708 RepID=A0ABQ8DDS2_BRANA|nr:hypothetical protein HID58_018861 [Brassica napus]